MRRADLDGWRRGCCSPEYGCRHSGYGPADVVWTGILTMRVRSSAVRKLAFAVRMLAFAVRILAFAMWMFALVVPMLAAR
jgi:hypothetical protein